MAGTTEIAWTDATFNPWWGCTKVGPGCDHCYAEAFDKRVGGDHWGKGSSPRILSDSYWHKPLRWQRQAEKACEPRKVFCGSMCDWADKNAPADERGRLWQLIRDTPMLRWQMLTKRAPNISKLLPHNWGSGYDNVWLGVTIENRKHGLRRLDVLREIPAKVRFLSIEPLLEDLCEIDLTGIHWVIVGGESGGGFRKMEKTWVENVIHQCREQDVAMFFKQWGGTSRNKGGNLLNGYEIKEWPRV